MALFGAIFEAARRMDRAIELTAKHEAVIEQLAIKNSIEQIATANPSDVQRIAGSQLELLASYHRIALEQSQRSFFWALVGAGAGMALFVMATAFSLINGVVSISSIIPLLSGAIVEVVAGVVFFLYGKTTDQISDFHRRLELLQRFLLANSLCESLEADDRSKARMALIREIYGAEQPLRES